MFEISKLIGPLVDPRVLIFAALIVGTTLLYRRSPFAGRRLVTAAVAVALFCDVVPVGSYALQQLEYRFPLARQQPPHVDGVVVLGGDFDAPLVEAVGARAAAPPRLIALAALARRYPNARLVFSGGSGSLLRPDLKESELAKPLLAELGVDPRRVAFEDASRNTYENALYTYKLAAPKAGEVWLLVTTAWHMPRAVGTFRQAGWKVVPYPVDFLTAPGVWNIGFSTDAGLTRLAVATREAVGLLYYWLLGRTDELFPGP